MAVLASDPRHPQCLPPAPAVLTSTNGWIGWGDLATPIHQVICRCNGDVCGGGQSK